MRKNNQAPTPPEEWFRHAAVVLQWCEEQWYIKATGALGPGFVMPETAEEYVAHWHDQTVKDFLDHSFYGRFYGYSLVTGLIGSMLKSSGHDNLVDLISPKNPDMQPPELDIEE